MKSKERYVGASGWGKEKSSLTEPLHVSSTPDCSKMSRRIAVPPPQQKFFPFSLSMVTTGAFHAASMAGGGLGGLGNNHRIVGVAPTRTAPRGAPTGWNPLFPRRPAGTVDTSTSNSHGRC